MLAFIFGCTFMFCNADIRPPNLISEGAVFQRDVPIKIWDWADPGERIILRFNDQKYKSYANEHDDWSITLPPHQPEALMK